MNLLPYVLCKRNNWKFNSEEVSQSAIRLLNTHGQLIDKLSDTLPFQIYSFDDLYNSGPKPIGLISISKREYEHISPDTIANVIYETDPSLKFVRGLSLKNSEKIILFPEQNSRQLSLAAFIPKIQANNDVSLHQIWCMIDPEKEDEYRVLYPYSDKCTLLARDTDGGREFLCKNDGCEGDCIKTGGYSRGSVRTIACRCKSSD